MLLCVSITYCCPFEMNKKPRRNLLHARAFAYRYRIVYSGHRLRFNIRIARVLAWRARVFFFSSRIRTLQNFILTKVDVRNRKSSARHCRRPFQIIRTRNFGTIITFTRIAHRRDRVLSVYLCVRPNTLYGFVHLLHRKTIRHYNTRVYIL